MFYHIASGVSSASQALTCRRVGTYIHLVRGPSIHAQRLDFRDVSAEFPMDGSASHAEEEAHLERIRSVSFFSLGVIFDVTSDTYIPTGPSCQHNKSAIATKKKDNVTMKRSRH